MQYREAEDQAGEPECEKSQQRNRPKAAEEGLVRLICGENGGEPPPDSPGRAIKQTCKAKTMGNPARLKHCFKRVDEDREDDDNAAERANQPHSREYAGKFK